MTKRFKKAILIGRFEPFHNGHLRNYSYAASIAEQVHFLIGSSDEPRTIKNPFTFQEREGMIKNIIGESSKVLGTLEHNYRISPLHDYGYNDNMWIRGVQDAVAHQNFLTRSDDEIVILGHEKDESSWYLRAFPNWQYQPLNGYVDHGTHPIDATKIRELYFEGMFDYMQGAVPVPVFNSLLEFSETPEYKTLVEEYEFIKNYKKAWAAAPYPPTFFCVDAVVIQGGHILLVRRKFAPGKGLWALPGGFLNPKETARTAMLRELKEETRIKVPLPVLQGCITYERLFDKPDRSLRGRTLSQAFLIELNGGDTKLPKIQASDDAAESQWFPINEVLGNMRSMMFDDHYSMVQTMVGHAK